MNIHTAQSARRPPAHFRTFQAIIQASLRTSDANEVKVRGIAGALGVRKARAPAGKAENDHGDADHPLGFNMPCRL